jgi:hypothetical protein
MTEIFLEPKIEEDLLTSADHEELMLSFEGNYLGHSGLKSTHFYYENKYFRVPYL